MARRTLPALFRSWAFKSRRLGRRHPDAAVLGLETFEDRVVPATLPTPTLVTPTATAGQVALAGNVFNPQVVPNPNNYTTQVLVATSVDGNGNLSAVYRYSANPTAAFTGGGTLPNITDPLTGQAYTQSSSPAVAYGRDGKIYFVYLVHNAGKTSGAVMFASANAQGGAAGGPKILYQWANGDPALNPTITVDNNRDLFIDPETNDQFKDTMATRTAGRKAVYVAWNGNAPTNPGDISNVAQNYNSNPIFAAVSGDDGATWSKPVPVSNGGYLASPTNAHGAAPQIIIAPGNSGAPGALVFAWPASNGGSANSLIRYDITLPDQGLTTTYVPQSYTFNGTGGGITDAVAVSPAPSPPVADIPGGFTSNLTLPANAAPALDTNTIQDLSVSLALTSQHLDQLNITLKGPNNASLILVNNRVDGLGNGTTPANQPFTTGLPGGTAANGGIGVNNSSTSQTVFSDYAARRITDPNSAFPYIGTYRPEGGAFTAVTVPASLLRQFLTSAGLLGQPISSINNAAFSLVITDLKANGDTTPQTLVSWGLTFSTVARNFGTDAAATAAVAPPIGTDYNNAPLTTVNGVVVSPTGIAPAVSLAFDTSLGSYSPFGGSLYLAYTSVQNGNPDVYVARGTLSEVTSPVAPPIPALTFGLGRKVNDDTASDNFTEGDRSQFLPAVTVDPVTGTVVATWYDTRLDAAKNRAATFVATSLDGGATWSDQTRTTAETADNQTSPFLNQPKAAIDFITGTQYTLQPVPTNVNQAGANGLGIRQSVIAYGGNIYGFWAGNANAAGVTGIFSGHAVTAAGPRVIAGDLGAVVSASSAGGVSYNTQVRADGTRGLDGFVVTFDRTVEAASAADPTSAINRPTTPSSTTTRTTRSGP